MVTLQGSFESTTQQLFPRLDQLARNQDFFRSDLGNYQERRSSDQTGMHQKLDQILHLLNESDSLQTNEQQNPMTGNRLASRNGDTSDASILRKLLSKPENFRQVCDLIGLEKGLPNQDTAVAFSSPTTTVVSGSTMMSSGTITPLRCSCRARRRHKIKAAWWGPVSLFSETQSTPHMPDCPMAGFPAEHASQTVGAKFIGFRQVLKFAVNISFTMKSGAGGMSIGKNFTYYPTVDEKTAPAFRIVRLFRDTIYMFGEQESKDRFLRKACDKLVELFRQSQASPVAVDTGNRNLMHHLARIVSSSNSKLTSESLALAHRM